MEGARARTEFERGFMRASVFLLETANVNLT